jgi:release factor glutamine methyltransferase
MSSGTYLFSDDSALLREGVSRLSGKSFLEVGAGNGGVLAAASACFDEVIGIDLSRPSMPLDPDSTSFVLADAATCFADHTFDVVALNPPYLPSESIDDPTVDGGPSLQVAARFLEEGLRAVKRDGKVLLVLNDQADVSQFLDACRTKGFALRKVGSRKLFYEELSLYEATADRA